LTLLENIEETEKKSKPLMVKEREFDQEKLKNDRLERIRIVKDRTIDLYRK